ncbi:MAG: response regulator transcription factor [Roseburia sp.]|nr:response regulator transcription factor [Roseburia sp.]
MQKILLIEDDRKLNQGISYALGKESYQPLCAFSLAEADKLQKDQRPDLVLLDVNLPDGEGFLFCQRMRQAGCEVPVIFLTARDLEEDILKGYELGAQDYVTKPFSMKVLLKKIEVFLKRDIPSSRNVYDDGFLKIDFVRAKAEIDGKECILTPTEFRLLQVLTAHKGQLLAYSVLLERLWDQNGQFVDKHALAVNVNRLRKKIEDGEHKYISNVYGMGYQWLRE